MHDACLHVTNSSLDKSAVKNSNTQTCEIFSCRSSLTNHNRNKRQRTEELSAPTVFANVQAGSGHDEHGIARVLSDCGASHSLVQQATVKNLCQKKCSTAAWTTAAGVFDTSAKAEVNFQLQELSPTANISHEARMRKGKTPCDMTTGRDLSHKPGIDACHSNQLVKWPRMEAEAPMKPHDANEKSLFHVEGSSRMMNEATRMSRILDSKHAPADLHKTAQENDNLAPEQKVQFESLLDKWDQLFDGAPGARQGDPCHTQLREDAEPCHAEPCAMPQACEHALRAEAERLCKTGVSKKASRSEWAFPSFIAPKKDKTAQLIDDLHKLNKRIERAPCPLPKTQDLLLKLQGFQWAAALDLNMGRCRTRRDADLRKLCAMMLPWGKHEMQALPMGLCNSPDAFQEKMSIPMTDFELVRARIDGLLACAKGTFEDHLEHLNEVFQQLTGAGLEINAKKPAFFQTESECLGCWIA